jgi:hypothetical protein
MVPTWREQLRQPHVGRVAVRPLRLENVVLRHHPAGRQPSPRGRHRLHGTAQLDLLLEQPIPRRPVLG